jgi:ABC-type bacteriocin/lantibiotic exporter with double-glycine peptidase domain
VKYRPELETVLSDLTLHVKQNEKIGVVGRTGSGKSTTILSLLRILQTHEGSIKIDGVDIYSLDIQSLRAGFSIILQDHFLFSGSVREVALSTFRILILYMSSTTSTLSKLSSCVDCGTASVLETDWRQ